MKMNKRMRKATRAMAMLPLLLCVSLAASHALAQESVDAIGFSVQAVLPKNQRKAVGYFDLLMEPKEAQVLWVEVSNNGDKPLRVHIDIVDAHSNANGLIVYEAREEGVRSEEAFTKMASLRCDLLTVGEQESIQKCDDNELVIAPQTMVQVPFEVKTPSVPLSGQVLGGIVIMKMPDGNGTQAAGVAIENQYGYAIAVQLQAEGPMRVAPQFSAVSASPTSVAGRDALRVTLLNEAPLVVASAQLSLRVMDTDENEVFAHTAERIAFAPQSEMPYTALFSEGMPAPGTYRVEVALTYKEVVWTMELPLVIS